MKDKNAVKQLQTHIGVADACLAFAKGMADYGDYEGALAKLEEAKRCVHMAVINAGYLDRLNRVIPGIGEVPSVKVK